ncbi:hypothetical protein WR25_01100 [Diploscapter pachys]|uniref:Swiss cheese n=1 Tax=Diploscapter pachys TaxID=2018661 RepID=A0A2A2J3C8_9BILA|nr:hypothetical protein WR25_01100 [Diploscapter pachys]
MGLIATLLLPITWTTAFFYTNFLLIFGTLVVLGVSAFLVSYYFYGFVTPVGSNSSSCESSARATPTLKNRKVSTIHESDEELVGSLSDPSHAGRIQNAVELRRMRKRDWAKKIYRSLVHPDGRRTPSTDDSSEGSVDDYPQARKFKRRHSTSGPFQLAKDLIRRGSRHYFRQTSDSIRERLPLPPTEFFEPTDLPEIPHNLQPEIFYILHNLKMLELPAEWKLDPREIEVRKFVKDEYIVQPGEQDDSIYVAIEGHVAVYIKHLEGKEYQVKKIGPGSSFFSLLSMLDILMGVPSMFKTVSLRALEPCTVAKFPIRTFRDSYQKLPEVWIRPIQIVITRLLHVTMTTLHQYMGLSSELMRRRRDEIRMEERVRHSSGQQLLQKATGVRLKLKDRKGSIAESKDMWADIKSDAPLTQEQKTLAAKWFGEALGLQHVDSVDLLSEYISVKIFEEGQVLVEQGSDEEQLMLILNGSLVLSQEPVFDEEPQDEDENAVSRLFPKELVGGLQLLTNEPSFYTVTACTKTVVAVIRKTDFSTLLEARPQIYLPVAHSVLRRLSPFLRGVDFALDWVLVDSGQAVYRAGDVADSMFVVLSGRLRSVEKKTVVEEFGRGDVLGMMEVLQKKPRNTTVLAVRFSQLARVPEGLLNFIKLQFPQVGFRLVQLLGQYYSSMNRRAPFVPGKILDIAPGDPMSHIKNLHTIAVVPASGDVPLVSFTCELYHALSANLRVLRLSSQKVATCLDSSVLEKQADFRLMHWLNVQEDTYPLVIYECDYTVTNWTRRCLRQADAILVVGMGRKRPQKHNLMRELLNMNQDGVRTNKELILLWPEDTQTPSDTLEWLKNSYFSGHHHIRAPQRMFQWTRKGRKSSKEKIIAGEKEIIEFYEKQVFWSFERHSDFGRLARILTGNAIGVVLGGGGARGASHVGVLKALKEQNVPIDIIGGTSIGSLIGGLYAEIPDPARVEVKARAWFQTMSSLWRKVWDLTYAYSAMFTGSQFNKSAQEAFGDRLIEDCWIPYFCITTDISTSEMRVHRSGPLWSYSRASMSLAGYLPPLCDPKDGHLLLDGGYVNNLPADVMRLGLDIF